MKKYIHKKTGKPYSLVGNTMVKENGVWRKGFVLYKTEYDNPDGEYFVRTEEDFKANFEELPDGDVVNDLDDVIQHLHRRYPEVSFAKLVRIVVHVARWQKEQIMKDAFETEVWNYVTEEDLRALPIWDVEKCNDLKEGDKVKVLIVKDK